MATHFARGILKDGHLLSVRLSSTSHNIARQLPAHRRTRYLASRALLAELLFMLYGISELPEIVTPEDGKPYFKDSHLPDFSIAYAGNIVGVALTTEGHCGLDMELLRVLRNTPQATIMENYRFTSNENLWINNQNDPHEARAQLITLRQSVLKMSGDVHHDSRKCSSYCRVPVACVQPIPTISKRSAMRKTCWCGRYAPRRRLKS